MWSDLEPTTLVQEHQDERDDVLLSTAVSVNPESLGVSMAANYRFHYIDIASVYWSCPPTVDTRSLGT
jgi:hypothetical protein